MSFEIIFIDLERKKIRKTLIFTLTIIEQRELNRYFLMCALFFPNIEQCAVYPKSLQQIIRPPYAAQKSLDLILGNFLQFLNSEVLCFTKNNLEINNGLFSRLKFLRFFQKNYFILVRNLFDRVLYLNSVISTPKKYLKR